MVPSESFLDEIHSDDPFGSDSEAHREDLEASPAVGRAKRGGKLLETARAVFMSAESSDYAFGKSLERTRCYRVGDSVVPEGLDCRGVDAANAHHPSFQHASGDVQHPCLGGATSTYPRGPAIPPEERVCCRHDGESRLWIMPPFFRLSFSGFWLD